MIIWQDEETGAIYQSETELLGLTPLGRKILCFFLQHPEKYLTKDEIIASAWGQTNGVSDDALYQQITGLRKALTDGHSHIKTWRGLPGGYRFHALAKNSSSL